MYEEHECVINAEDLLKLQPNPEGFLMSVFEVADAQKLGKKKDKLVPFTICMHLNNFVKLFLVKLLALCLFGVKIRSHYFHYDYI